MSPLRIIPEDVRARGLKMIALAAVLYLGLRLAGVHRFFAEDGEGLGALLQIIGTLYSVVYAFAIYVIWGQFAAVENEILKESGALKDLVVFSKPLKDAGRDPVVRAVKAYARSVAESEWGTLSRGEDTEKTERLLGIANLPSAHRDERLALSAKRIPKTLLLFVTLTAAMILLLLLFFPFHNLALGMASMAIATMLLFFANFLLTDLDNPFQGTWNVRSEPFSDLVTKLR